MLALINLMTRPKNRNPSHDAVVATNLYCKPQHHPRKLVSHPLQETALGHSPGYLLVASWPPDHSVRLYYHSPRLQSLSCSWLIQTLPFELHTYKGGMRLSAIKAQMGHLGTSIVPGKYILFAHLFLREICNDSQPTFPIEFSLDRTRLFSCPVARQGRMSSNR